MKRHVPAQECLAFVVEDSREVGTDIQDAGKIIRKQARGRWFQNVSLLYMSGHPLTEQVLERHPHSKVSQQPRPGSTSGLEQLLISWGLSITVVWDGIMQLKFSCPDVWIWYSGEMWILFADSVNLEWKRRLWMATDLCILSSIMEVERIVWECEKVIL